MIDVHSNQFKNILAFCILMGGAEVLSKSPDYITEKHDRYVRPRYSSSEEYIRTSSEWKYGLDSRNTAIFEGYLKTWG